MPTLTDFAMTFALYGAFAVGASAVVIGSAEYACGYNFLRPIPRDVDIAEGFAKPSQLEITVDDVDPKYDGNEVTISFGDQDYFLKVEDGGLQLVIYHVEESYKIVQE